MLKILLIINFALLVSGKPGNSWDADGDGIHNEDDWDDDNDGIHDDVDWDDDNDGIHDEFDWDHDNNDGLSDDHGGGGNSLGGHIGIAVILTCVFVPLVILIVLIWCLCRVGICF